MSRKSLEKPSLAPDALAHAEAVQLSVLDNGPGLAGQGIETLSAAFYSSKPDGMGMGLAICRSIVDAHQGSLRAADAQGGGARFYFSLPTQRSSLGART
jgi:two-component system sensor histidine kinase DctS